MTELELKEKLLDAENLCPGMMPIDYDFARCLADYLNEPMTPRNFALFACLMVEDIRDVLIETDEVVLATYPKVFKKKGEKMLRNAQYILQIIDVVTEPEFADEVRQFLKVTMGWDVVKRVKAVDDREYPHLITHRNPAAAAAAKSLHSCPTLCDPIDGSPPGSPIPGILQARTL